MIETELLLLRPIQEKDNKQVFSYRSDYVTNKYQGFIPRSLEEVDAFIAKKPIIFNQPNSWFQLIITEKISNKIVGDVGIHFTGDDNLQCELGCTLSKKYHGKGYATAAMRVTINHLFFVLNKHRITCSVDPRNCNSIKLLERLNFRKEAHFKESLLIDGEWVDDIIYSILKKEWQY